MSEKDSQNQSCPQFNMYDTSCKTELKSNVVGKYYNSMEYTNHNFQHVSSEGKNDENLEKSLSKVPLPPPIEIKLYKRRFLMLFLASFCSMMNAVPQFQFSVIADIVACYYGVSVNAADWTSIVYMVIFLPLVFPVMFLMDKKGLRYTVLGGGFLNCLGGWIQCAGLDPSRYIVIMVSQTIYAMGQVFLLSLPPFIAGVWFGAGEVGLACAFGVFGNQLGVAAGFIIPPLLIENNCTHQLNITHELTILSYPVAVINTVLFIALILVYQEKPKLFPSAAQAVKQSESVEVNYIKSLKNLGKDVPYILLFIVYGLITGTYFSMSTILNQMVLIHFDDAEVDAGWMGAGMVFTGMAGSLLLGAVLDKTHRFKEISLLVCCSSFLLIVAYSLLIIMDTAMWVQFVFFGLLGFFLAGYLPVGLDFGAEITYPESEAVSAGLLNASCQLFGIVITIISSALIEQYGDTASNIFFCACLLLATIITACIRCQLKRTIAGQCGTKE